MRVTGNCSRFLLYRCAARLTWLENRSRDSAWSSAYRTHDLSFMVLIAAIDRTLGCDGRTSWLCFLACKTTLPRRHNACEATGEMSAAASRVSDRSRIAETRRRRGSGAAESAARWATPSTVFLPQIMPQVSPPLTTEICDKRFLTLPAPLICRER